MNRFPFIHHSFTLSFANIHIDSTPKLFILPFSLVLGILALPSTGQSLTVCLWSVYIWFITRWRRICVCVYGNHLYYNNIEILTCKHDMRSRTHETNTSKIACFLPWSSVLFYFSRATIISLIHFRHPIIIRHFLRETLAAAINKVCTQYYDSILELFNDHNTSFPVDFGVARGSQWEAAAEMKVSKI